MLSKGWIAVAVLTVAWGSAQAVVLESGDTGASFTPNAAIVGRCETNGTYVAIGADYILTTRHQNRGVGDVVMVNGSWLKITQVWDAPSSLSPDPNYPPDLQIDYVPGANFTSTAAIYTGTGEKGTVATIGGYGRIAGSALVNAQGKTYGYNWLAPDNNNNEAWGDNLIDGTGYIFDGTYITAALQDHFDIPGSANAVAHEASVANYDSGGGWFEYVGGQWYLVGLTDAATGHNPSGTWFGDVNYAVRMSDYASWIDGVTPEPATLTLLAAGGMLILRRRRK